MPGTMRLWEKHSEVTCPGGKQAENLTSVGRGTEAWLRESHVKSSRPGVRSLLVANCGLCP